MNLYGVKFSNSGKIYYFNAEDMDINLNLNVIVETEKGLQYGKVIEKIKESEVKELPENIKKIIRVASKKD